MYLYGFGNYHQTEALSGALPPNQNSPQKCADGLYAEQISGTAFTRPRHKNLHSWMYRTQPSVVQKDYSLYLDQIISPFLEFQAPNPYRWSPLAHSNNSKSTLIQGLIHIAGNSQMNVFLYQCSKSMQKQYFSNLDGEMLFVPFNGTACLFTEMGKLELTTGNIAVIPRGIKFKFEVLEGPCRGYLCENSATPLTLPNLGIIGANGLAHPRHFAYPVAAFEKSTSVSELICKSQHRLWTAQIDHSPLNVVAWHGNYAPYSYDLSLFNTINTVSFDHPDPSIFTVLTSESPLPGIANLDFVIFPPRWMVADHTFRPPYFHRNYMNEMMGLIKGQYDAKKEGFQPGGLSIHNCMTPHGPDNDSYRQAIQNSLQPEAYTNTLAFMFETREVWNITQKAFELPERQTNYSDCWQGLENNFNK